MDSINKEQPEDNFKNLQGAEAWAKAKEIVEDAKTCFFCSDIKTGLPFSTRPMSFQKFDNNGDWARHGKIHAELLANLKSDPFFKKLPPKSTGRDLFHAEWLIDRLRLFAHVSPVDVQATLCALTAYTISDAVQLYASDVSHVYICGGGAYNTTLINLIHSALNNTERSVSIESTEVLGVSPSHVEALAFAWLAYRHTERLGGNLPEVTGAAGERILGALYPH